MRVSLASISLHAFKDLLNARWMKDSSKYPPGIPDFTGFTETDTHTTSDVQVQSMDPGGQLQVLQNLRKTEASVCKTRNQRAENTQIYGEFSGRFKSLLDKAMHLRRVPGGTPEILNMVSEKLDECIVAVDARTAEVATTQQRPGYSVQLRDVEIHDPEKVKSKGRPKGKKFYEPAQNNTVVRSINDWSKVELQMEVKKRGLKASNGSNKKDLQKLLKDHSAPPSQTVPSSPYISQSWQPSPNVIPLDNVVYNSVVGLPSPSIFIDPTYPSWNPPDDSGGFLGLLESIPSSQRNHENALQTLSIGNPMVPQKMGVGGKRFKSALEMSSNKKARHD
ncbi:hypothetical protein BC829DRAFT_419644 [Chytridium lagenaria]|nr:hypothetical protein BC829DRAFT_419644 [Chytridium lagenaria]